MQSELEPVNLGYSTKNIPIPDNSSYLKSLISKTELFLRNLRWKTFFFLNPNIPPTAKETYGFKSTKLPPFIAELKEFEDGLMKMIQSIEFENRVDKFQKQLSADVIKIKKDDRLFVPADKTTNFYKLHAKAYNDLLAKNITKDYKKADTDTEKQYTQENKLIAEKLDLCLAIKTICIILQYSEVASYKYKHKFKTSLIVRVFSFLFILNAFQLIIFH